MILHKLPSARLLAMAAVGAALLSGPATGGAEVKKPERAAKTTPPGQAAIPEIRRTAVIANRDGEKLLASPIAIARDAVTGDLLVVNFEAGEVAVLDGNGALIKRLGADAELKTPYGIALDGKGRIYVSEVASGLIKILSPAGEQLDEIDLGKITGRKVTPGRITLADNGLLYVADLHGNQTVIVNDKGELVRTLGGCDYLQKAGAVPGDRILLLSSRGQAVNLYSRDGAPLSSFGRHGDPPGRNVSFPTGFAVDAKGRLWIADAFQHTLKVFSLDGKFLFNFGRMEEKNGDGGLLFPVDLLFGRNGELFVVEKGANRIQIFRVADLKE